MCAHLCVLTLNTCIHIHEYVCVCVFFNIKYVYSSHFIDKSRLRANKYIIHGYTEIDSLRTTIQT